MRGWLAELRRRRRMLRAHRDPVAEGRFRLMILNDDPYPTYISTRAWCSGTPYWGDGTCRCTHTEEPPRG